eukprot:1176637-Prorocentrum_minimum.AAC.2
MRRYGASGCSILCMLVLALQAPSVQAKRMMRRGRPALHYTAIPAKNPAKIDLAIVMLDNRHIAKAVLPSVYSLLARNVGGSCADKIASLANVPCDDYWSASVAINRLFAEMHGYHFYQWHDTHNAVRSCGCDDDDEWLKSAMGDILNPDPKQLHPAWQKMLPIYCHLKKHKMVLWIDSDAYVADITQPIELLLHATKFVEGTPPPQLRVRTGCDHARAGASSHTNPWVFVSHRQEELADIPRPPEAGRVQRVLRGEWSGAQHRAAAIPEHRKRHRARDAAKLDGRHLHLGRQREGVHVGPLAHALAVGADGRQLGRKEPGHLLQVCPMHTTRAKP